jgi:hypothetical protein
MLWLSIAFMLARDVPDGAHARARESTKTCERDVHKGATSMSEGRPLVDARPMLLLDVETSADVPRNIVDRAINEATAIWESAGIGIQQSAIRAWNGRTDATRASGTRQPFLPGVESGTIAVVIDDEPGAPTHNDPALGWIRFNAPDEPERRIHLSRRNTTNLLDAVAGFGKRPVSERELLVGRALGRTLAHELGHYLLRSKEHTPHGLMRATVAAEDFFSPSRGSFYLECDQMTLAAAGLRNGYPSHSGIISRGTIDRWDLGAHRTQIARKLSAVVDGVEQKAEEHLAE